MAVGFLFWAYMGPCILLMRPGSGALFATAVALLVLGMVFISRRSHEFQKNEKPASKPAFVSYPDFASNSIKWRQLSQSPSITISPSLHPKILKQFR
jgi:hypothetical protein